MFANSDELLKYVKDEGVEMVDVRFCDLPGVMQHFTVPVSSFDQSVFDDGLGFDGSSIRGFQAIHESDMSLFPDPTTAYIDPFRAAKTLVVNFFIHDPITGEAYSPRPAQHRPQGDGLPVEHRHRRHGVLRPRGRVLRLRLRCGSRPSRTPATTTSTPRPAPGTPARRTNNRGYKVKYKGGYFPVAPYDHFGELRDEMVIEMEKAGLHVERAHHEVGTAGQAEINYKFDELLKAADDVMKFKYIVKNVAWRNDKTATFMPKPIFGDNGSGMHCHQSHLERRRAAVLRRDRLRRPVRHRALLHRRHPQARPVAAGVHQPDGELLPPPGAGLRGPDQPGLQPAQPLGLRAHPDHRLEPEGQAHRVPLPRPVGQPVPRLLGAAAGRPRRHQEQDRAATTRSTRTSTSCRRTRWPRSTRCRPRSAPCSTTSRRDHDFLTVGDVFTPDLIETWIDYKRTERDPARAAAPAPARVRALLRHLVTCHVKLELTVRERGLRLSRGPRCTPESDAAKPERHR